MAEHYIWMNTTLMALFAFVSNTLSLTLASCDVIRIGSKFTVIELGAK